MKTIVTLIITLFVSLFPFADGNMEERENAPDFLVYTETDDGVTIDGLTDENISSVTVPEKINGKNVVEIKSEAFAFNAALTEVFLPSTLKKIGKGAFSGCAALRRIKIPFTGDSAKSPQDKRLYPFGYIFGEKKYIGGQRITQYYRLDRYDEVTSSDYYIPETLETVEIDGECNYIPNEAFYNCSSLKKIIIGKNVTDIGEFAFSGCVAEISWKDPTITTIGENAFADYKGTSLTIPEGVEKIEKGGYGACENVKSFTMPDSLEEIGVFVFAYCYTLKEVCFGQNTKKIGLCAFYFCIALNKIELNENLEEIEENSFDSCKAIEIITLPTGLKKLLQNVFYKCNNLSSV
ncbi:MAG: leucine-rich repeat domain-containing protein, partial [Clostridia bacterium]|nr:leucine-rich repeat domain-containing protein [Clostridia bacterium]